jgi:hypothetical protein
VIDVRDDAEIANMIELQSRLGGDEESGNWLQHFNLATVDTPTKQKPRSRCAAFTNVLSVMG